MTTYLVGLALGLLMGGLGTYLALLAKMERYRKAVQAFVDEIVEEYQAQYVEATEPRAGQFDPDAWGGQGGYLL